MALRPVAIGFSAAADGRSVFIDRATTLVSVGCNAKQTVVSEDPSSTIANVMTAPANVLPGVIWASTQQSTFPINFPLPEGRSIFVSSAAAQPVILYFDDGI